MPNLYGVQNQFGTPIYTNTIGGGNVTVPVGVETPVCDSGLIIAPSNGYFSPLWLGVLCVTMGATNPTTLVLGARIGAGADYAQLPVPANLFIAGANLQIPLVLGAFTSQSAFQPPGSHCYLTVVVTGQGVQVSQPYSSPYFWLTRGPDQ